MHVDLGTRDPGTEIHRLVGLGAQLVDPLADGKPAWREGDSNTWVVLKDPEGKRILCWLVPRQPRALPAGPPTDDDGSLPRGIDRTTMHFYVGNRRNTFSPPVAIIESQDRRRVAERDEHPRQTHRAFIPMVAELVHAACFRRDRSRARAESL